MVTYSIHNFRYTQLPEQLQGSPEGFSTPLLQLTKPQKGMPLGEGVDTKIVAGKFHHELPYWRLAGDSKHQLPLIKKMEITVFCEIDL